MSLEKIRYALQRLRGYPVKVVSRKEWYYVLRPSGRPTRLEKPLTPFARVPAATQMVTMAVSGTTYAINPGLHHVRRDEADTPDIFNTDSYDVIEDLPSHPSFERVLQISGISDRSEAANIVRDYVFIIGPHKRPDHHSSRVPKDIKGAKKKK